MLRELAWKALPGYMSDRAVRYQRRLRDELGMSAAAEAFVAVHGDRVLQGPFAGLRYSATGDMAIPRLLGTYEHEISTWLTAAVGSRPALFIDLGTSDGYYAVGMKVASPSTRVHGFELSSVARRQCAQLAALNGVRVDLHGRATPVGIEKLVEVDTLILSDIEGYEADVFTTSLVSRLRTCTVIIELHEAIRPGVTEQLRERFAESHVVEVAWQLPPLQDRPEFASLDHKQLRAALFDGREPGSTCWARMSPR